MTDKKQFARHLYLTQGKTQKEIAIEVGVSERTIYTWIHQYAWQKLKLAAYQAPAAISDNLCSQLVEMQNEIAAREEGKRYPTTQEADVMRKLIMSIETMKKTPSLSQNMQMMEAFRSYVRPLNDQFSKQLAHYANRFLAAKSINGYAPYQMEYGIDLAASVAPFYDELDGMQPCITGHPIAYATPCISMDACPNTGHCNWPKCILDNLTADDPKQGNLADDRWKPVTASVPVLPEAIDEMSAEPEIYPETITGERFEPLPAFAIPEQTGSFSAIPEISVSNQMRYL